MSNAARVLLVDDHAAILDRVAQVLGHTCTVVGAVSDGPSALDAAAILQPDVIVLDITMNGMSGLDVAARLKASRSNAAIVFLTIHDDPEFVAAARAAGGTGYVVKSRLASDLPHAVADAVKGRPFVSPDR